MNPTAPTSLPAHRLRRYTAVYSALRSRLSDLGLTPFLLAPDGSPLTSATPSPDLLSQATAFARSGETSTTPQPFIRLPLGRGQTDALLVVHTAGRDPQLISHLLASSARDVEKLVELNEASGQMAERLAQGYEQMHVLFGLARLMDGADDPAAALTRVLQEARTAIPIAWIALHFNRHPILRPELSRRFLYHAAGRTTPDAIAPVAESLLETDLSALKIFLPGQPDGLVERLGNEFVALPIRYEGQTVAVLLAGEKTDEDAALSTFETQFLTACGSLVSVFHENLTRFADQRALFVGTVRALTSSIDAKHPYTRGHSERVALLARQMAERLGLSETTVKNYHLAGLLHDVGKIGVPESILSKPGKLTDEEFAVIKTHPRTGYDILRDIPHLEEILPGVLHHHEQFRGHGYPDGLAGQSIPLVARVLALADTFDAMSSSRSYRSALSRETVLTEIRNCSGRQFDPDLVPLFLSLDFTPFDRLFHDYAHTLPKAA